MYLLRRCKYSWQT